MQVCDNDTRWRDSVHIAPYPIELTVEPFWKLLAEKNQRDWLKGEYEKYLVTPQGEEVIKRELKISAHCADGRVLKACYTTVISAASAVVLIVVWSI